MRTSDLAPCHFAFRCWSGLDGRPNIHTACDFLKLAGSAALFASPWAFEFTPAAAWNLWVCGYVMLIVSLADVVAEANWEPRTNLCLGAWTAAAPWILGFVAENTATFMHLAGGGLIAILSVVELFGDERNPPWRFRPSTASRAHFASSQSDVKEGNTRNLIAAKGSIPAAPRRNPTGDRTRAGRLPDYRHRCGVIRAHRFPGSLSDQVKNRRALSPV